MRRKAEVVFLFAVGLYFHITSYKPNLAPLRKNNFHFVLRLQRSKGICVSELSNYRLVGS
jgi:hypothetical protein